MKLTSQQSHHYNYNNVFSDITWKYCFTLMWETKKKILFIYFFFLLKVASLDNFKSNFTSTYKILNTSFLTSWEIFKLSDYLIMSLQILRCLTKFLETSDFGERARERKKKKDQVFHYVNNLFQFLVLETHLFLDLDPYVFKFGSSKGNLLHILLHSFNIDFPDWVIVLPTRKKKKTKIIFKIFNPVGLNSLICSLVKE